MELATFSSSWQWRSSDAPGSHTSVCLLASDGQTVECMTVQAAREFLTGPRHTTDILVNGISDLLLIMAMALLRRAGVSYLGLGVEPLQSVMVCLLASDGQTVECMTVQAAREFLTGPRHTTDFHPDPTQDSGLYLVFPSGIPSPRHVLAMTHMANLLPSVTTSFQLPSQHTSLDISPEYLPQTDIGHVRQAYPVPDMSLL
jgi:hypothetical protein